MNRVTVRFTTQHPDFDTGDRPILYVEGLDGGYVASGEEGESAQDYADRLCRDGLPEDVIEQLSAQGLLGEARPVAVVPEHVPGD